jgi:hypothetical protein
VWIVTRLLAASLTAALPGPVGAEAMLTPCAAAETPRKQAKLVWKRDVFMSIALLLQGKGEAQFRLAHDPPESLCIVESFEHSGFSVRVLQSPWQKGMETLLYRLEATHDGVTREVLVIYDGLTSFSVGRGSHFYLAETRGERTAYYAAWNRQPSYAMAKTIALRVLAGEERAVVEVEWPVGAKESLMHVFDMKRLR